MTTFKLITVLIALSFVSISGIDIHSQSSTISVNSVINAKAKLAKNKIRLKGFFMERFEERALYAQPNSQRNPNKAIWIYFGSRAKKNYDFEKLINRELIIEGTVDTTLKGHCSSYQCSVWNADIVDIR